MTAITSYVYVLFFIWRFLGGWDGLTAYNNILEYNQETEEWQEVGVMKEPRFDHSVTVVSYEDYAEWCIWELAIIAFWCWFYIAMEDGGWETACGC